MADVSILDESGTPQVIDEADVADAIAHGWRPETPDEWQSRVDAERYGNFDQEALGAAESLMRGATFGLSDVVSREAIDAIKGQGAGLADAKAAQARQRTLGPVSTGLEVAGAIIPGVLSGGTGATGALARLTPAGASSRLGLMAEQLAGRGLASVGVPATGILGRAATAGTRMAAGGAVEGALMGGGQALSEEALSGGNYEGMGEKVLAGAAKGFVSGGALGGALGTVGGGIAGASTKLATRLKSPLENFANERAIKSLGAMPGQVKNIWKKGGDEKIAEIGQEMFRVGILKPGRKADDMIEAAAAHLEKSGAELGAFRQKVYDAIDDAAAKAKASGYRAGAKPLVDVTGEVSAALRKVESDVIAPLTSGLAPKSMVRRARKVQAELEPLASRIAAGGDVTMKELVAFRMKVDDILYPPKGAGAISLAPEHLDQLAKARGIIEDTIGDITDRVATKLDPKMAGKYGELKAQFSKAADINKLAESGVMRDMANRWTSPSDYGSGLALAAGLIGGGAPALASLAKGAAFSFAHKLMRERGSSLLAVAAYRAAKGDKVLSASVKQFLTAGARKAVAIKANEPRRAPPTSADYAKRLGELSNLDPQQMRGFDQGAAEAPKIAAATAGAVVRAKAYLTQEAPTGLVGDDPLQPHLTKPQPNRADLERYARKWEAVDDPVGTVERRLADGTLTREHVEAIKAVYPVTYQEIRQKVFEELADSKERVPYDKRVRLGILFDFPADKSLRPDQIARTQALYAVTLPNEQAAQGPAQPAQAPLQLAQSHATPAQAIEGGMNQF